MSDFGAGFRKARESLGISLEEIANETRIGTRFLEAIETEDFHRLPGGVFNRGFIRSYAQRVGLDPAAALAQYDRLVRTEDPQLPTVARHSRFQSHFKVYPIALGALLLLFAAIYLVEGPETNVSQKAPPAPLLASPEPVVEAAPEPDPITIAAVAIEPSEAVPVEPQPQELALELAANEETWMRVSRDGSPATEELLQAGAARRYTAQSSLDVTIGNAGGVNVKVNDRELGSLGQPGQVRTLLLTPDNVGNIR
jgi:cytoskeleton protein RodZ